MNPAINQIKNEETLREYSIIIAPEGFKEEMDRQVQEIQKTAKIAGFRPGKAPVATILRSYQEKIFSNIIDVAITKFSQKIDSEITNKIYKRPEYDITEIGIDVGLKIKVVIHCFGDFDLDYSKIKLNKKNINPDDINKEVNEELEKILFEHSELEENRDDNYEIKLKDIVNIDYIGKIDGVEFNGGSSRDHILEIGSKSFIDNFEEQLIGKKTGDDVLVNVKFPENYHNPQYSGKNAEFSVKINHIKNRILPTLDDNFVKENLKIETLDKLKDLLADFSTKSMEKTISIDLGLQVKNYLKSLEIAIPELARQDIINSIKADNNNIDENEMEEKINDKIANLKISVVINKVSKDNKIQVEQEDMMKEITFVSKAYQIPLGNFIEMINKDKNIYQNIYASAYENKILDFIASKAEINNI
jgi:trigger factor